MLVAFSAAASFAAVDDPGLPSDAAAQTIHSTNNPPIEISAGINHECFSLYCTSLKNEICAMERRVMPAGSMKETLEQAVAIALLRDGDKNMWSLAPSLGKISLNPMEDIKNLQVLLQYQYRFKYRF